MRLVEARTNFIVEKKQEIEKSQEKDEVATAEIVIRKDQKTQHHEFIEAMADKGESFLAKTHSGKHARLINKSIGIEPDLGNHIGVYFWDPQTQKHTLELFKLNNLKSEKEDEDEKEKKAVEVEEDKEEKMKE